MIVYIVFASEGEYEDYRTWVEHVFISKEEAEKYVEWYNFKLTKIPERIEKLEAIISGFPEDYEEWTEEQHSIDSLCTDLIYGEPHKAWVEEFEIWDMD